MDIKDELRKNIINFKKSAELVYETSDYTSASILYFKALFVTIDYILLTSGYGIPKDHTERFRTLERVFPELYKILDRVFSLYRNTYTTTLSKFNCDEVKDYVNELIKKYEIQ